MYTEKEVEKLKMDLEIRLHNIEVYRINADENKVEERMQIKEIRSFTNKIQIVVK